MTREQLEAVLKEAMQWAAANYGEPITDADIDYYANKLTIYKNRTPITPYTYQTFQRAYESGFKPEAITEITGFGRSTVFRLIKDYTEHLEYFIRYASKHKSRKTWQEQTPCPVHIYIDGRITTVWAQIDNDINRISCTRCDWFQDFPRYPAIKERNA
jgi:hypothetical protein